MGVTLIETISAIENAVVDKSCMSNRETKQSVVFSVLQGNAGGAYTAQQVSLPKPRTVYTPGSLGGPL
jgi:hypothetical protein